MILANLWLFTPLFLRVFSKMNSGSALLRTTVAATMAQGSPAPNLLPQKSSAVVNCRILPGEDGETLLAHLRKVLSGLPVGLEIIDLDDPSALSPSDTPSFATWRTSSGSSAPAQSSRPTSSWPARDAKKYEAVSKNVYRFTPYLIGNDDLDRIHGTDECISVANINRCIDFFMAHDGAAAVTEVFADRTKPRRVLSPARLRRSEKACIFVFVLSPVRKNFGRTCRVLLGWPAKIV